MKISQMKHPHKNILEMQIPHKNKTSKTDFLEKHNPRACYFMLVYIYI